MARSTVRMIRTMTRIYLLSWTIWRDGLIMGVDVTKGRVVAFVEPSRTFCGL